MILSELGFELSLQEQRATSSSLRPMTHPGSRNPWQQDCQCLVSSAASCKPAATAVSDAAASPL